jgi:hypothetical protein
MSARATFTFAADRDGPIEFGGRLPGELQEDGPITVDRVPYRVMRGRFTANGIAADCRHSNAIIRRPAEAALTPTLRLRWSWRVDELPSQLP